VILQTENYLTEMYRFSQSSLGVYQSGL